MSRRLSSRAATYFILITLNMAAEMVKPNQFDILRILLAHIIRCGLRSKIVRKKLSEAGIASSSFRILYWAAAAVATNYTETRRWKLVSWNGLRK